MRISRAATLAILTTTVACLTGCGAADQGDGNADVIGLGDDGETELGTAEQAFSSVWYWGYGISGDFQADAKPWATHTAFLMAITGNMVTHAGASLGSINNVNELFMGTAPNHWLGAGVGAVGSVNGRTSSGNYENRSITTSANATPLGPSTDPKVRCFLNGAYNKEAEGSAPAHNAWSSTNDYVDIFSNAGKWYLGGHGRVGAWAGCMKVTTHLGSSSWAWDTVDKDLDLGFDEPGKHCWLTGLGGKLRSDDTSKGVRVYFDGGTQKWRMFVSAGMYGKVECNK